MDSRIAAAVCLALTLSTLDAAAGDYRYVDRHGRVHFMSLDDAPAPEPAPSRALPPAATPRATPSPVVVPRRAAHGDSTPYDTAPTAERSERPYLDVAARYQDLIVAAASRHHVPVDLVRAVIRTESNFKSFAVSRSGAMGLMQLMPATAAELGVEQAFDAAENIDGGTRYLAQLMRRFNGDLIRVIAGYHAGPGAVTRYAGIPPYPDTVRYVQKVLAHYMLYASAVSSRDATVAAR